MKKITVMLVVLGFVLYACFKVRHQPLVIGAAAVPLLALFFFINTANPANPTSILVKILGWLRIYPSIQEVHAWTLKWTMYERSLVLLLAMAWLFVVLWVSQHCHGWACT